MLLLCIFMYLKPLNRCSGYTELNSNLSAEFGDGYIKYTNGTLICYGGFTAGTTTVTLDGYSINFPVPFKDTAYKIIAIPDYNGNIINSYWIGNAGGNREKYPNAIRISWYKSASNYSVGFSWYAIGHWK